MKPRYPNPPRGEPEDIFIGTFGKFDVYYVIDAADIGRTFFFLVWGTSETNPQEWSSYYANELPNITSLPKETLDFLTAYHNLQS